MTSLYHRIGGSGVIEAVIDEFYERVLDDPCLAGCFEGVDMSRLRAHQRTFIAAALDGPERYSGAPLGEAHAGLEITDRMFDRTIGHLGTTLLGLGLDPEIVGEISLRITSLRDGIVSTAGPMAAPSAAGTAERAP